MIRQAGRGKAAYLLIIKVLLILSGLFLTNHTVLNRLDYFLEFNHYFPLVVFLGIWAVALAAILYVAFTPNVGARIFWVTLIGLSTLLGETYFLIVQDQITIAALDAMWDPGLASVGMFAFYSYFILRALVATTVLVTGLLIPPTLVGKLKHRIFSLVPLIPCLLLTGLIYYVAASRGNETKGMPSQFYNLGLFTIYTLSDSPSLEKSEVEIPLQEPSDLQYIILIVDESVSGDFIDLNVPRGTTPYLASSASSILNFGLALSASNCSNASNAILRLGANPETLGKEGHSILNNPSIWKYAAAAGFETSFIDAQYLTESNQNYMNDVERGLIDHHLAISHETKFEYRDFEVIDQLREIINRPSPQFVYINKRGAHFPYQRSYPVEETVFKPAMETYEPISSRERLVNTYKNAIRWSVDHFFQTLFETIDLANFVIVYTSDHGQNLLDDGQPVTHCRRTAQTLTEAVVPLMVWTDHAGLQGKFRQSALQNHNAASHFEIFPTLLILFGYEPEAVRLRYHQSLFEEIDTPLGFTSGPITGRFGRQPVWNSREGLEMISR